MPRTNVFAQSLLNPEEFTFTYELVPGQGSGGKRVDRLLQFAARTQQDGRIKALSITDNPGGVAALAPVALGTEIHQLGIEPLIHFSLKDKNRNQVESHLFLYQRLKLYSLLVLGGDFPRQGYHGQARPVFDLDTIQTLQLIQDMETGCYRKRPVSSGKTSNKPVFLKGCVVSPFKLIEAEQIWQYIKLLHKIKAGADFIITQLGFDLAKFQELLFFCRQYDIEKPLLANIFIPSLAVAKVMAAGKVPGVVFPQELVSAMEREHKTTQNRARLDRAVFMIRAVKELGYHGVHIGGNGLRFSDLKYIMDQVEAPDSLYQRPQPTYDYPDKRCWYLYTSSPDEENMEKINSLHPGIRPGAVRLHQLSHHLLFSRTTRSAKLFGCFCLYCKNKVFLSALLTKFEQIIKRLLFNCRMCGDCTLEKSAYLCPQSGCPKRLVNGPCGGSLKGYCEVFPDKPCFWVKVYNRLPPETDLDILAQFPALPPKNWALEKTSSWINFFTLKAK